MFLRRAVYYIQNNRTGEQTSLRTKDEQEAKRLLEVHNLAGKGTALNLELGKVYLRAADPKMASRTWQAVMRLCGTSLMPLLRFCGGFQQKIRRSIGRHIQPNEHGSKLEQRPRTTPGVLAITRRSA
jgi:hypothetical protein